MRQPPERMRATPKVGLIGLGRIGSRFLEHLLNAGHEVVLHDSNRLAVERVVEAGKGRPAGT
jgi:3-hydroxyisobutyrate dehydrogenase-like beta-hydroxyacid dehydrogenase